MRPTLCQATTASQTVEWRNIAEEDETYEDKMDGTAVGSDDMDNGYVTDFFEKAGHRSNSLDEDEWSALTANLKGKGKGEVITTSPATSHSLFSHRQICLRLYKQTIIKKFQLNKHDIEM